MSETLKPFVCTYDGCKMTFTNEDHLNVHKKKHDMALHIGIDVQNNAADQTPTPTRFIRNCEEVGLFQDLQNVNPFDETFRKAVELTKSGSLLVAEVTSDDTLHTPHVFPHIAEDNHTPVTSLHVSDPDCNSNNRDRKSDNPISIEIFSLTDEESDKLIISNSDSDVESSENKSDNNENNRSSSTEMCTTVIANSLIANGNLKCDTIRQFSNSTNCIEADDCNVETEMMLDRSKTSSSLRQKRKETVRKRLKEALKNKTKIYETHANNEHVYLGKTAASCAVLNTKTLAEISSLSRQLINNRQCHRHSTNGVKQVKSIKCAPTAMLNTDTIVDVSLLRGHLLGKCIYIRDNAGVENAKKNKSNNVKVPVCDSTTLSKNKERQREFNRAAQHRSRARKKHMMHEIKEEIALLRTENKRLTLANQNLKDENCSLKALLLYNSHYGSIPTQQTIEVEHCAGTETPNQEPEYNITENQTSSKKMVPLLPNLSNTVLLTAAVPVQLTPVSNSFAVQLSSPPNTMNLVNLAGTQRHSKLV